MSHNYPLPHHSQQWLNTLASELNPALYLQKFQPWTGSNGNWSIDKKAFHKVIVEKASFDPQALQAYIKRWHTLVRWRTGQIISHIETAERLVVGFGIQSTLETSMSLHPLHGFPYIPSSAVKGLCATICIFALANELMVSTQPPIENETTSHIELLLRIIQTSDNEQRTEWQKLNQRMDKLIPLDEIRQNDNVQYFQDMFGRTDQRGQLIFFDGIPNSQTHQIFDRDVMTPHFQDYYTGEKSPADDLEPVPIPFLAVKTGINFYFGIGCTSPEHQHLVDIGMRWLTYALCELGIGAKTNRGYGRFRLTSSD